MSFIRNYVLGAVAAAALTSSVSFGASAATSTVGWGGSNSFNTAVFTAFTPFQASQLTDIVGLASYDACCSKGSTNFSLSLLLDSQWTEVYSWTSSGDFKLNLLSELPTISWNTNKEVSGIKLASDPPGKPDFFVLPDPNFQGLNFWLWCTHFQTKFIFDSIGGPNEGPGQTPLPAALPLMATILAGGAGLIWRRRKSAG